MCQPFFVQSGVYDEFTEKLAAKVGELKIGNGLDNGVTQGPLVHAAAADSVEAFIADVVGKGASIVMGGKRQVAGKNFFEPTIVTGATTSMRLAQEEISAPLHLSFNFQTKPKEWH